MERKNFHWNPITDDGDAFRLICKFPVNYYIDAMQCGNLAIVQEIINHIKSEA